MLFTQESYIGVPFIEPLLHANASNYSNQRHQCIAPRKRICEVVVLPRYVAEMMAKFGKTNELYRPDRNLMTVATTFLAACVLVKLIHVQSLDQPC